MTTTITLPTTKPGQVTYHTIEFSPANFDKVIEAVSEVKTIIELANNKLWTLK